MPGKGRSGSRSAKKASAGKRSSRGASSKSKRSSKSRASSRSGNIEEMKKLLLGRRNDLLQGMEHNLQYQSSPAATKGDSSDLAADALDSDTAMQLAESGSSELAQIDEALRKIEEKSYGQCEACGSEIPWGRLEAVPYATLCVRCKEQQERAGLGGTSAAGWSAVDEFETLERDL